MLNINYTLPDDMHFPETVLSSMNRKPNGSFKMNSASRQQLKKAIGKIKKKEIHTLITIDTAKADLKAIIENHLHSDSTGLIKVQRDGKERTYTVHAETLTDGRVSNKLIPVSGDGINVLTGEQAFVVLETLRLQSSECKSKKGSSLKSLRPTIEHK